MRTSLLIALSPATSMVSANAPTGPSKASGSPPNGTDRVIHTIIVVVAMGGGIGDHGRMLRAQLDPVLASKVGERLVRRHLYGSAKPDTNGQTGALCAGL